MGHDIPEQLLRFPTREAIASLALRFDLPNDPHMQDWEWEVADSTRINEFVYAYESGELSDDEKFTLMETIIESFEELDEPLADNPLWQKVLNLVDDCVDIHICSIWYWSLPASNDVENQFRVTRFLRPILEKHRAKFVIEASSPD